MRQNETRGMLLALAGFALLSVGDAVVKTMAGEWSPIAVAALRFTIGATVLAGLLLAREGRGALRPANPLLQIGRGVALATATLLMFSAIFVMPLAEATALVFVAPVFTALLSGPLLKEQVRPATWVACALALVGVGIILRPNLTNVGWLAFLPLGAALCMSLVTIANRASAGQGSSLAMQAYIAGVAAPTLIAAAFVGAASGGPALAFGVPDWSVVGRCALVALTASSAHWLVYLGTERAGASRIAPMTYVQLLVAAILGWLLFDDRPDLLTLLGALVIIAAGLYLWRDGRLRAAAMPR